jgi:hypothetical protein
MKLKNAVNLGDTATRRNSKKAFPLCRRVAVVNALHRRVASADFSDSEVA